MRIMVCVKRVPASGGAPQLTEDGRGIDTRHLSFTVGPHEECAIEEAVQLVERFGGSVTVLTVGPAEAEEQLRFAISLGADHGILVEAGPDEVDPQATAFALTEAIRDGEAASGAPFDLIMFGNESPDAGHYQVGVRVACALGRPIVGGVKGIDVDPDAGRVRFRRDTPGGAEVFEAALPAAVAVREGLNLPRYPSMRGRLRARKAEITELRPHVPAGGLRRIRLRVPEQQRPETVVLGHGASAAPAVVDLLEELEVV
ncbi:electron transfer flavoprotein subunit beta/FixA family protein [Phytoactinopolyspora alkaliphila]|uniref:Electron transfer flavoprotein subunit beta/FixA family protein n=1 Tax=Phytoactinopolyspora alkaliphila TaxID=1783498 RepID=A0A6N9YGU8_9ACTN|nr:electron transfer flavoprotein subunit beta/FixA family protein [Phytoactinopolyspora alkaliphila]NED94138.1 electron transfer flavoprotein subunit beta/FixA family protein [Phytoactinopolyspora alkaliphila]